MFKGSCACGDFTYEVPEDLQATIVCHCIPCQKTAGSNGSANGTCGRDQYKQLSGNVRTWKRTGDSGNEVTNAYCSTCSTFMWVEADALPDVKIIKIGTLDDKSALENFPIVQEIYTKNRPSCIDAFQNAPQNKEGL